MNINFDAVTTNPELAVLKALLGGLSLACFYAGVGFFKLKNKLLGFEYIILGLSALCGLFYMCKALPFLTGDIWNFTDMFSRLVGVSLFVSLGILQVTHRLHLRQSAERGYIALAFAVSFIFFFVPALKVALPILYLLMGFIFIVALGVLAVEARKRQLKRAFWLAVTSVWLFIFIGLLAHIPLPQNGNLLWSKPLLDVGLQLIGFTTIYYAYVGVARDVAKADLNN